MSIDERVEAEVEAIAPRLGNILRDLKKNSQPQEEDDVWYVQSMVSDAVDFLKNTRGFRDKPRGYRQFGEREYWGTIINVPEVLKTLWYGEYIFWREGASPVVKSLPPEGVLREGVNKIYQALAEELELEYDSARLVAAPIHSYGTKGLIGAWQIFKNRRYGFYFVVEQVEDDGGEGLPYVAQGSMVRGEVDSAIDTFLSFEDIQRSCKDNSVVVAEERRSDYAVVGERIQLKDFHAAYKRLLAK